MKNLGIILLALAAMCLVHSPGEAQQSSSFVVIVHPDNPAKSVSKKKVSRLLLKELSKWDGGLSAHPCGIADHSPFGCSWSCARPTLSRRRPCDLSG